jgi:hypothetical protein
MKTVLIYHESDIIDREITSRWLSSFSDLSGLVALREKRGRMKTRIKREIKRVGPVRFLDVLAFRFYYKTFLSQSDNKWKQQIVDAYKTGKPDISGVPVITSSSPNAPEVREFIRDAAPDIMIARCKTLLKEEIFSIPTTGTFVLHPGICPEYRNAHGCFWALVNEDYEKVGLTLLKIDSGIDTGPIYGYYSYRYDALVESPFMIQHKVFTENLDPLEKKFLEIAQGKARPLEVDGRDSNVWGQPWFTSYLKIKRDLGRLPPEPLLPTNGDPSDI